jgi:hypothetical protein
MPQSILGYRVELCSSPSIYSQILGRIATLESSGHSPCCAVVSTTLLVFYTYHRLKACGDILKAVFTANERVEDSNFCLRNL